MRENSYGINNGATLALDGIKNDRILMANDGTAIMLKGMAAEMDGIVMAGVDIAIVGGEIVVTNDRTAFADVS